MTTAQRGIYENIEKHETALRRGYETPQDATFAIFAEIDRAYHAYVCGIGGRIDKRAALHKAFAMLAKITKE